MSRKMNEIIWSKLFLMFFDEKKIMLKYFSPGKNLFRIFFKGEGRSKPQKIWLTIPRKKFCESIRAHQNTKGFLIHVGILSADFFLGSPQVLHIIEGNRFFLCNFSQWWKKRMKSVIDGQCDSVDFGFFHEQEVWNNWF